MTHEIEPGYDFQEEMAAEEDGIQRGTFRFVIACMVALAIIVAITVQWVIVTGQEARVQNALGWEGPSAARVAKEDALKKLSGYEVIDAQAGTYQIPIERAMALEVADYGND